MLVCPKTCPGGRVVRMRSKYCWRDGGVQQGGLRYLEALTKRPDIAAREEEGEWWDREVEVVYL